MQRNGTKDKVMENPRKWKEFCLGWKCVGQRNGGYWLDEDKRTVLSKVVVFTQRNALRLITFLEDGDSH